MTVRHSPDYVFELPEGWGVWDPAAPDEAARAAEALSANPAAAERVAAAARGVGEAAAEAGGGVPATPFACLWIPDPETGAVGALGYGLDQCRGAAPGGRPTAGQWVEDALLAGEFDRDALFAQVEQATFERRVGSGETVQGVLQSLVYLEPGDTEPVLHVALRVFPPDSCCLVGIQLETAAGKGPEDDVRESLEEAALTYWASWEPAG